jgi:anti-sigma regulatory factor (Ser/Thr protein kinase)
MSLHAEETLMLPPPFRHQALLYADEDEYLAGTVPFVEEGVEAGEPVLVAVPAPRLEALRANVDGLPPELVRFVPMEELGRNPAWIIPVWSDFVAAGGRAGRAVRGVGEPVWVGRTDDELAECTRHEALLNLAFAASSGFALLCPYDASLGDDVLDQARRSHPHVGPPGHARTSHLFDPEVPAWLDGPLPPVPPDARLVPFDASGLRPVRRLVGELARAAGLRPARVDDLVVAVSEAVTNSVVHGGGGGEIAVWSHDRGLVCEVRDRGRIDDPMAGRRRPGTDELGGRGLWLIHQLCDLVQLRARPGGQVLRLLVLR